MSVVNVILYLLCCVLAYVFSLSYVGWYGVYLFWTVLIIPPLLSLVSIPSMRAFKVVCSSPSMVNRGDKDQVTLRFLCRRLLPVRSCTFTLRLKNVFTGKESTRSMRFGLVSNSSSTVELPTAQCGMVLCSVENIKISSYLGLLCFKIKYPAQCSTVVMPKPLEPESLDSLEAIPPVTSAYRPKPGGGYSEEHELRQYRPGDSINSIHWKISCKTDDIIVREPLEPVDSGTAVVLGTATELDIAHLYWLSLQLCRENTKHDICYGTGKIAVENETDCVRAMRLVLSTAGAACKEVGKSYSRIFTLQNGEVHWQ